MSTYHVQVTGAFLDFNVTADSAEDADRKVREFYYDAMYGSVTPDDLPPGITLKFLALWTPAIYVAGKEEA